MKDSASKTIWPRFKRRFGSFQLVTLSVGTILIVSVAVLLGTLWEYCNRVSTPSRQQVQNIWSDLVLRGWLSQFVTICSAILRICISMQLLLVCMMLASLALENRQVRDQDIGITFIHQYANSGPFGIAWQFITAAKSARKSLGLLAIMLLTLESVFVQFSSTILFGDLKLVLLREGFDTMTQVNYTFGTWDPGDDLNMLRATPIEFPVFAEKSAARITVTGGKTAGMVDSGSVIRALLPLRGSKLASLASYRGPVMAVNTQAVCFAPKFVNATVQFHRLPPLGPQSPGIEWRTIETVNFLAQIDNMEAGSANRKLFERSSLKFGGIEFDFAPINCTLTANTTSICEVTDTIERHERTPREVNGFPAVNMTDVGLHWLLVSNSSWINSSNINPTPIKRDGNEAFDGTEWATQNFPSQDLRIRHSLCAILFKWAAGGVDVDVTSNYTEPRLYRNPPSADGSWEFDTTYVQRQLGSDGPKRMSNQDRGILNLPSFNRNESQKIQSIGWSLRLRSTRAEYGTTIPGARTGETRLFEPTVETLFMNSYHDTKQLSLAWEAAMMTSFTTFYYHLLDFFVLPGDATIRFFKWYAVPRKSLGLFVVFANIVLHFVLVSVILWAFFSSQSFKDGIPDLEELRYLALRKQTGSNTIIEFTTRTTSRKRRTHDKYVAVDSGEE
ncbi:hypothetical protein K440DRAFT_609164 [Wilcoxina mikolae CBS 423.85]|nr:hypothetical protein K440DRAFT_609164 [Wilcoxina mikolae CBS 423.85]